MRYLSFFILLILFSCNSGEKQIGFRDIAEEISLRYNASWFHTVAFSQYTIRYVNKQPADTQVWHELYQYPGNLIIKFDSISSGSGLLFRNDSMYDISNDTIMSVSYMPHDLIVLTMDMYKMKSHDIVKRISGLGYDTSAICRSVYNNKPVLIIGTNDSTDRQTRQFWLGEDDLICYRVIMPREYGTREVLLNDILYKNGRWMEQEVIFKKNNDIDMKEGYYDIVFNYPADSTVFYPDNFSKREW